jgi:hypothetical protein
MTGATPIIRGMLPSVTPIAANGYHFAKWQGKPNSATPRKPSETSVVLISRAFAPAKRLRRIHRDT